MVKVAFYTTAHLPYPICNSMPLYLFVGILYISWSLTLQTHLHPIQLSYLEGLMPYSSLTLWQKRSTEDIRMLFFNKVYEANDYKLNSL